MLRLVWKDLVAGGWFLLLGLPLYAIQLAGTVPVPPVTLVVTALFTGALAFGSLGVEEVQGTEAFWCSLPVNRRDVVWARYASTAIGLAIGLVTSGAVVNASRVWIFTDPRYVSTAPGAGTYGMVLAAFLLAASIFLPCYFRYGAGKGLVVLAAATLGLLVLGSILGWLIVQLAGGAEALEALRAGDPARVAAAVAWLDRWGGLLSAALAAISALVFGASALLSARFYSERDV